MANERTYGNTSHMENALKLKYHASNYIASSTPNVLPVDCITCRKGITHRIPDNARCQAVCGNNTSYTTIGKRIYAKIKTTRNTTTVEERRLITKMANIIQNTKS